MHFHSSPLNTSLYTFHKNCFISFHSYFAVLMITIPVCFFPSTTTFIRQNDQHSVLIIAFSSSFVPSFLLRNPQYIIPVSMFFHDTTSVSFTFLLQSLFPPLFVIHHHVSVPLPSFVSLRLSTIRSPFFRIAVVH